MAMSVLEMPLGAAMTEEEARAIYAQGNRTLGLSAWLHFALRTTLAQLAGVFNFHLTLKATPGGLIQMWRREEFPSETYALLRADPHLWSFSRHWAYRAEKIWFQLGRQTLPGRVSRSACTRCIDALNCR